MRETFGTGRLPMHTCVDPSDVKELPAEGKCIKECHEKDNEVNKFLTLARKLVI